MNNINIKSTAIGYKRIALFTMLSVLSVAIAMIFAAGTALAYPGELDTSFNAGGSGFGNANVWRTALQPDGEVIIVGGFTSYNGVSANRIIRLNTDGSIDNSLNSGTGFGGGGSVNEIIVQPDGKLVVGGAFTSYNGTTANRIIRLNTDGSIDNSFNTGSGINATAVYGITVQLDGKIIVGGLFTSYNGTTANRIIRLNTDGSIDSSFNIGTGFNDYVNRIYIQPDQKILITGAFTSYNGTTANRIIRLNLDGSTDSTFNSGAGFDGRSRPIIQANNKLIVGGDFTTYNGIPAKGIALLNLDGSIDTNFSSGSGFYTLGSNNVVALAGVSDSVILTAGTFTSYNGASTNRIIALNYDGSINNSYNFGTGFDDSVWANILVQPDGKILLGGGYTLYNGVPQGRIARLDMDLAKVVSVSSADTDGVYSPGQTVTIDVKFDEVVNVDTTNGTPTLALNILDSKGNNLNRQAIYTSGSGTNKLSFTYTFQTNDSTNDLDYLSTASLLLNGGTVKDIVNNNLPLTLPIPGQPGSLAYNNDIRVVLSALTVSAPDTGIDSHNNRGQAFFVIVMITGALLMIKKTLRKDYYRSR